VSAIDKARRTYRTNIEHIECSRCPPNSTVPVSDRVLMMDRRAVIHLNLVGCGVTKVNQKRRRTQRNVSSNVVRPMDDGYPVSDIPYASPFKSFTSFLHFSLRADDRGIYVCSYLSCFSVVSQFVSIQISQAAEIWCSERACRDHSFTRGSSTPGIDRKVE